MTKSELKKLIKEVLSESQPQGSWAGSPIGRPAPPQRGKIIARLLGNGSLTLKSAIKVLRAIEKINEKFVVNNDEDLLLKMEEILTTFLDSLKLTDDELDEITLGLLGNPTAREMIGIMQTIVEEIEKA